jgi:hypothetical protein
MFEHERSLNEFTVQYLEKLVTDLDETDMDRQLAVDVNPPRWILGHLAVSSDYVLRIFGHRFECPIDWHRSFARGTAAASRPTTIPPKSELMQQIHDGYAAVRQLTINADSTAMNQPHSVPFLRETPIATVGDVLAHLMTTHLATHTGQISFWRRINGRARVEPGTL